MPGTTTSVNTLNPSVQISGPYSGSARSTTAMPFSGKLSLQEALERGLAYNLGAVGLAQTVRQTGAQVTVARSALLPNINGSLSETVEQNDLAALGLRISVPGFRIPTVVGPFNYFALQASLSQTVANLTAINNYRSARATARASQYSLQDARDLVTLAVGGAYLQVLAAQARVDAAQAQLDTANAVFHQSTEQHTRGRAGAAQRGPKPGADAHPATADHYAAQRSRQTEDQPGAAHRPRRPMPAISSRTASPSARRRSRVWMPPWPRPNSSAPTSKPPNPRWRRPRRPCRRRAPSACRRLAVSGDYEVIGTNPAQSHGAFTVVGTLSIPLWQGGRTAGDIAQAEAVLAQRQAELDDTRGQIEAEVRQAYLDLEAAAGQVEVARKNLQVAQETLEMTRARMEAGVINTVEVVQAQQTVASAQLDLIDSVFAHNLAKLSLARALGHATDQTPQPAQSGASLMRTPTSLPCGRSSSRIPPGSVTASNISSSSISTW